VVNLSVATSESWKDKSTGERQERTEWHRVVIWNEHLGDVAERWLRKGSKVYLEGQLQTRKWTDNAGVEKYTTEVVLQRFRGELTLLGDGNGDGAERAGRRADAETAGYGDKPPRGQVSQLPDLDDEIPF
jgi:single-strand DNA-binding protein